MNQEQNVKKRREGSLGSFISALPIWVKIFYIVGVLSIFLFGAYIISESFADFFNLHIAGAFRFIFASITNILPFSFAEILMLALPILLALALWYLLKFRPKTRKAALVSIVCIISAASLLFSSFVLTFSSGYRGSSLEKKLELVKRTLETHGLDNLSVGYTEINVSDPSEIVVSHPESID